MQFTRAPYEILDPLIYYPPNMVAAGQFYSAYVNVGRYHREALMLGLGHMDAAIQVLVQLYQAQDAAGTGAALIGGKFLNLVDNVDDNALHTISLRNEELIPGYAYVQVRLTVTGLGAVLQTYTLFGLCADYEPVPTTGYGNIVP
jgi:hypothetical protein